jgi:hypothetical protein
VRHDPHEIGILGERPVAADVEVGDTRWHHGKIAGEIDHVHHLARRLLLEPDPHATRIGLELSGADVVRLHGDVAAGRNHEGGVGGGDRRPDTWHEAGEERGPRLTVVAHRRHPKPDAVRVLKASRPVIGMAEALPPTMVPHRLLHSFPRQVADEGMVHDLSIARQKLDRPHAQILVTVERQHQVAVDVVAVRTELRRLGLLEHDVGGAEILLEGRLVGQWLELRRCGGIALGLAGRHPGPQHGNFRRRRGPRTPKVEVGFDLRRRHPPGVDLFESEVDPFDGVVVGEQAEGTGLIRAVAALALGMEKR